jgi:hypothetical protein
VNVRRQIGRLWALSCAGIALVGCASAPTTPQRAAIAEAGHQAASWDTVLPGPGLATAEPGPEYTRRDAVLNIRDLEQASLEPAPRLDRPRRVFVRPRPDEVIFFRRGHDHRRWW